jgi:methylase of polypeptide subunit release factors
MFVQNGAGAGTAAMPGPPASDRAEDVLVELLHLLGRRGYHFVTPTPATHARVLARPDRQEAASIEDVLGWSLPYRPGVLDREVEALLDTAGQIETAGARRRSRVRVSSLHGRLFVHSAYPTLDEGAVFFGPDSYRFADLIRDELRRCPHRSGARIVDIGTGSGVGGIVAASACPGLAVSLTDVNPLALSFARINARAAGIAVDLFETDGLDAVPGGIDIATANPPYIIDPQRRLYRDGGGMHGGEVSLAMAGMAVPRLASGGRLILYTGSAIVRGRDALCEALAGLAGEAGCSMRYREIDPDVFGEELANESYAAVDRIALVAAVIERS